MLPNACPNDGHRTAFTCCPDTKIAHHKRKPVDATASLRSSGMTPAGVTDGHAPVAWVPEQMEPPTLGAFASMIVTNPSELEHEFRSVAMNQL